MRLGLLSLLSLSLLASSLGCGDDTQNPGGGGSGGSGGAPIGAGGVGGAGGAPNCPVLDADTVANLTFGSQDFVQLQPNQSTDLEVGILECCYVLTPVDACINWSIDPPDNVIIAPDTGFLLVDANAVPGSEYTITADVGPGQRTLQTTLYVYSPEANPLVGLRHEIAQLPCGGGAELPPEVPIAELAFWADGTFQVTWMPFELYVDYWGTYEFDYDAISASGSITLTVTGGNYIPPDVDGAGTFDVDANGDLVLHDIWLGTPQDGVASAQCGHRFE
ncbi:MAG: hypothetical protein U0271_20420 [Polyangiaceae bacterium]